MTEFGFYLMRSVELHRGPMDSTCILWTGAVNKQTGYGIVRFDNRAARVHRVAYFLAHGRWPNECRHKCDVRRCYNVLHLEDGTRSDNMRDMTERGRNKVAILDQAKADEIRVLVQSRSVKEVAEQFGVSAAAVYDIRLGRTWAHTVTTE